MTCQLSTIDTYVCSTNITSIIINMYPPIIIYTMILHGPIIYLCTISVYVDNMASRHRYANQSSMLLINNYKHEWKAINTWLFILLKRHLFIFRGISESILIGGGFLITFFLNFILCDILIVYVYLFPWFSYVDFKYFICFICIFIHIWYFLYVYL